MRMLCHAYQGDQLPCTTVGEDSDNIGNGESASISATSLRGTCISRDAQLQDANIEPIFSAVEKKAKIKESELKSLSRESGQLSDQWDLPTVKHGKLWRRATPHDGHPAPLQLIVLGTYRSDILAELHDSPTGGHHLCHCLALVLQRACSRARTRTITRGRTS